MSKTSIQNLNVKGLARKDCTLFLWVTFPCLQEGIELIEKWGFKYKTCGFVWVKTNKRTDINQTSFLPKDNFDSFWGMGYWTRANVELCLIGTKGNPKRVSSGVHQVVYSPIKKHSEKPAEVRDRIVKLMGDLPRIELFARHKTKGWDVWGNEVQNSIEI